MRKSIVVNSQPIFSQYKLNFYSYPTPYLDNAGNPLDTTPFPFDPFRTPTPDPQNPGHNAHDFPIIENFVCYTDDFTMAGTGGPYAGGAPQTSLYKDVYADHE